MSESIRIIQHGSDVCLLINGTLATTAPIPYEHALAIAARLHTVAKDAEEHSKAESVAQDAGILIRAGANIGLSSRTDVLDEAKKIAAWDRNLRRYMPGGVKSREAFGRATITGDSTTKGASNG